MTRKKFLGIDPGTGINNCAWAVYINGTIKEWGTISLKNIPSFGRRLTKIAREIADLLEKHEITHIACETFFVNPNQMNGVSRIPELRGVLQHYADIYNTVWIDVYPTQMKKYVTGSGKATKQQIMRKVRTQFKLPANDYALNNHEADAIGIAFTGNELSKQKS